MPVHLLLSICHLSNFISCPASDMSARGRSFAHDVGSQSVALCATSEVGSKTSGKHGGVVSNLKIVLQMRKGQLSAINDKRYAKDAEAGNTTLHRDCNKARHGRRGQIIHGHESSAGIPSRLIDKTFCHQSFWRQNWV